MYCLVAQICSFSSREQVYFSQKFTLDSAVYVTINKQCILLLSKDILTLVDEMGHDKVSLLGHSMGGKVAMSLALSFRS